MRARARLWQMCQALEAEKGSRDRILVLMGLYRDYLGVCGHIEEYLVIHTGYRGII